MTKTQAKRMSTYLSHRDGDRYPAEIRLMESPRRVSYGVSYRGRLYWDYSTLGELKEQSRADKALEEEFALGMDALGQEMVEEEAEAKCK